MYYIYQALCTPADRSIVPRISRTSPINTPSPRVAEFHIAILFRKSKRNKIKV